MLAYARDACDGHNAHSAPEDWVTTNGERYCS